MLSSEMKHSISNKHRQLLIIAVVLALILGIYLSFGHRTGASDIDSSIIRIGIPYVGTEPQIEGYEYLDDFTRSFSDNFEFDIQLEFISGKTKSEMLRNLNLALLDEETRPDFLYYCLNSNYLDLDDLYKKGIIVDFPQEYTVRADSLKGLTRYTVYQPVMLSGYAVNLGKLDDNQKKFLDGVDTLDLQGFYELENLSSSLSPLELNDMSLEIESLVAFRDMFNKQLSGSFKLTNQMVDAIDEDVQSDTMLRERMRIRTKLNLDQTTSYFDNMEIIKNNRLIYDYFDPLNPKYTSELMSKKSDEEINLFNVDLGSTYLTLRTWGLIKVSGRDEMEQYKLYTAESIGNNYYNERLYYNRGYVPASSSFLNAMFEKTGKSSFSNSKLCTELGVREVNNINISDLKYYYLSANELICYQEFKDMLLRCYLSDDSYDKGKVMTDITNFKNKMKLLLGE